MIQVVYPVETTTIGDMINMIASNATEPELAKQSYVGLTRPKRSSKPFYDLRSLASIPGLVCGGDNVSISTGEVLAPIPEGYSAHQVIRLSKQILSNKRVRKLIRRNRRAMLNDPTISGTEAISESSCHIRSVPSTHPLSSSSRSSRRNQHPYNNHRLQEDEVPGLMFSPCTSIMESVVEEVDTSTERSMCDVVQHHQEDPDTPSTVGSSDSYLERACAAAAVANAACSSDSPGSLAPKNVDTSGAETALSINTSIDCMPKPGPMSRKRMGSQSKPWITPMSDTASNVVSPEPAISPQQESSAFRNSRFSGNHSRLNLSSVSARSANKSMSWCNLDCTDTTDNSSFFTESPDASFSSYASQPLTTEQFLRRQKVMNRQQMRSFSKSRPFACSLWVSKRALKTLLSSIAVFVGRYMSDPAGHAKALEPYLAGISDSPRAEFLAEQTLGCYGLFLVVALFVALTEAQKNYLATKAAAQDYHQQQQYECVP